MAPSSEQKPEGTRPWRALTVLLWSCAVGALGITLAGFLGRSLRLAELLSHFRMQYLVLAAVVLGGCVIARRWRAAAVAAVSVAINAWLVVPVYFASPPPPPAGRTCRAMLANVFVGNRQFERLIDLVRCERPDLLLVNELGPAWAEALEAIHDAYPYRALAPSSRPNDPGGIGLYSRLPLSDARIERLGGVGWPTVAARVEVGGEMLVVIGSHPFPPRSREFARIRNRQLAELAACARRQRGPVLLLGDLNMSPWSPYFRDLLAGSGLADSRAGFGVQPSWPVESPILRIPIDHALTSPGVLIHARRIGPDVGSDHFPLIVDFSVNAPGGTRARRQPQQRNRGSE